MSTDYSFDGLNKWEHALAKLIDEEYPKEFERLVIQIAYELQGKVKVNTPKKTGRLVNSWKVGKIIKEGAGYYIEVYTNIDYAEAVEYGHRSRGGSFVKGKHMMEISLVEVEQTLPAFLKDWLNEFLNTHDI